MYRRRKNLPKDWNTTNLGHPTKRSQSDRFDVPDLPGYIETGNFLAGFFCERASLCSFFVEHLSKSSSTFFFELGRPIRLT